MRATEAQQIHEQPEANNYRKWNRIEYLRIQGEAEVRQLGQLRDLKAGTEIGELGKIHIHTNT